MPETDWRRGADPRRHRAALKPTKKRSAVCVVHNETSIGCVSLSPLSAERSTGRTSTLLLVDAIVAGFDRLPARRVERRRHRRRGQRADAPAGTVLQRAAALRGFRTAKLVRLWDWRPMLRPTGFIPYTPATIFCVACRNSRCLKRLANVFTHTIVMAPRPEPRAGLGTSGRGRTAVP